MQTIRALILIINLSNILVFLIFKVLYKIVVFIIKLIILKLTLEKQLLINKYINLY